MKATVCVGFSSPAGATGGVYENFAFAVVEVFRGFAVVHLPDGDVFFDSLPDVSVVGVLVLVFVDSDAVAEKPLSQAADVRVLPDAHLFELPVLFRVDEDESLAVDSSRAFRADLILCAFIPALVASTGAAKTLATDATSIAQKSESRDGLYPSRRGILMDVR